MCIPILAFILQNHLLFQFLLSSFNASCCFKAAKHIFEDLFGSSVKTPHNAIIASHSYLFINHFSSIIISDILLRYSLRNQTKSSGENCSDILVNHSISEKNMATFLFSQSKFTLPSPDNISLATSEDTYSERALFNLVLFLLSIKYLNKFDIDNEKITDNINSAGKFRIK